MVNLTKQLCFTDVPLENKLYHKEFNYERYTECVLDSCVWNWQGYRKNTYHRRQHMKVKCVCEISVLILGFVQDMRI